MGRQERTVGVVSILFLSANSPMVISQYLTRETRNGFDIAVIRVVRDGDA